MQLALQEQTLDEFLSRLRNAWWDAEGPRAALLARFIVARLATGDIDKEDYKRVFNMDEDRWDAFASKLNALLEAYAAVEDATGAGYANS